MVVGRCREKSSNLLTGQCGHKGVIGRCKVTGVAESGKFGVLAAAQGVRVGLKCGEWNYERVCVAFRGRVAVTGVENRVR